MANGGKSCLQEMCGPFYFQIRPHFNSFLSVFELLSMKVDIADM